MNVTIVMTTEEFEEFLKYRKDNQLNSKKIEDLNHQIDLLAKKIGRAVAPNPKKPDTYKIVDQEEMDDLWILSGNHVDE